MSKPVKLSMPMMRVLDRMARGWELRGALGGYYELSLGAQLMRVDRRTAEALADRDLIERVNICRWELTDKGCELMAPGSEEASP